MKDFINYYYDFNITDIRLINEKFYFTYDDNKYVFEKCLNDYYEIDSINRVINQISKTNPYYHRLILNKDKKLITLVENQPYVMILLSFFNENYITLFDIKGSDIVQLDEIANNLIRSDWISLWQKKIDFFETIFMNNKDCFNQIIDSFNYYIGMAENAIMYIKEATVLKKDNYLEKLVISHKRISKNMKLIDYYNPIGLIIDYRSRDIAEYLKTTFYYGKYDYLHISDYLYEHDLSEYEVHLLIGRLLFPSIYFDSLEQYINDNDINGVYYIENKIYEYEEFILEIFNILEKRYNLRKINWIIKKI